MQVPQDDVRLPGEVIALIISYIPRDDVYMRALWSCCLVSREWYKAAIEVLYAQPQLSNKNFDLFARTICPPVNSHIRRIGLEIFVRRLDMGVLAYESSKSLTARLLRRTRVNLETFVAPAVTFSITSLAPLSKCTRLRTLDLSRDYYDIGLVQLLHAIRSLPIEHLSLPRGALQRNRRWPVKSSADLTWPPSLRHLESCDQMTREVGFWQQLFISWPPSLVSVAFNDCFNWEPFWILYSEGLAARHIKNVRISIRRESALFEIALLRKIFPVMVTLAMPSPMSFGAESYQIEDHEMIAHDDASQLEVLTLGKVPYLVRVYAFLPTSVLSNWTRNNPKLRKINIPEGYIQVDNDSADQDLERIEEMMSARATENQDSGVYLT